MKLLNKLLCVTLSATLAGCYVSASIDSGNYKCADEVKDKTSDFVLKCLNTEYKQSTCMNMAKQIYCEKQDEHTK